MNIFVRNLPMNTSEVKLREAFSTYGEISAVKILKNKLTNQYEGFGFIQMPIAEEANQAIQGLNGKTLIGKTIYVFQVKTREDCKLENKLNHPEIIR